MRKKISVKDCRFGASGVGIGQIGYVDPWNMEGIVGKDGLGIFEGVAKHALLKGYMVQNRIIDIERNEAEVNFRKWGKKGLMEISKRNKLG